VKTYEYSLTVTEHEDESNNGETYVAAIDGISSPLRGHGKTPVEALAQLTACLTEWPISGADRWLSTPDGTAMARSFCPTFEPVKASEPS